MDFNFLLDLTFEHARDADVVDAPFFVVKIMHGLGYASHEKSRHIFMVLEVLCQHRQFRVDLVAEVEAFEQVFLLVELLKVLEDDRGAGAVARDDMR